MVQKNTYDVFNNVVENLRFSSIIRNLINNWRHKYSTSKHERYNNPSEEKNPPKIDLIPDDCDIQTLLDHYRDKNKQQHNVEKYFRHQLYLNTIDDQLQNMHSNSNLSQKIKKLPFNKWNEYTPDHCKTLISKYREINNLSTSSNINTEESKNNSEPYKDTTLTDFSIDEKMKLNEGQKKILTSMKNDIINKNQMLYLIHGCAGSGKTEVCKRIKKELGIPCIYTATTGSAASNYKGFTINKVLKLGRNTSKLNKSTVKPTILNNNIISQIQSNLHGYNTILIDEVSMLSPSMLNEIHNRLCIVEENEKPFGGYNIILVGDFKQLKPVINSPCLYQRAVDYHISDKPMSLTETTAIKMFIKFKKYDLKENLRAKNDPQHSQHCSNLRKNIKCPITPQIVSSIKTISKKDIENDPTWRYTPIVVPTNKIRLFINKQQIQRFAKEHNEPIFSWPCPVKMNNRCQTYHDLDEIWLHEHPELQQHFVRGAPISLRSNICTQLGLAN